MIPDLIIAANALVSNDSKLTERIQMADVKCHGLTSTATSNLSWRDAGQVSGGCGQPVLDQLPQTRPEDGRRPGQQGAWKEKLRDDGNPVLGLACGHCDNMSGHVPELALLISGEQAID